MQIYTPECLAKNICILGAPCHNVGYKITPNTILYDFDLYNMKDFCKIKRLIPALAAFMHETIAQSFSPVGHFRLEFLRKEREIIPFEYAYHKAELKPLEFVIGEDSNGDMIKMSVADMVSALCVGTAGSGKSTFLHTFITSLCCSTSGKRCGLVMIDCKQSELVRYNKICKHLMCDVAITPEIANSRLHQIVNLMQKRYADMEEKGINKIPDDGQHIIVIIDELAELMLSSDKELAEDTKTMLIRLCQLGRACGIHCLLCTQTPRVAVVDGLIQANTPTKFALRTTSARESIIAIGHGGCDKLLGRGDMYFKRPDDVQEIRIQSPYISTQDIQRIFNI